MCNKKTEHFISIIPVVLLVSSFTIIVGNAVSSLIIILLSSLLEFFQYVDFTSVPAESQTESLTGLSTMPLPTSGLPIDWK
jgi:hypothetical protein